MIMITAIDALPDYCYECPCHNGESGYCQADKERRYSDYRPYWCPLKEICGELLKEQEPREITKDEWESWKKAKYRDPLCMYWRGDIMPFWILRPEQVCEPAYLIGDIKIFNGKPDKEKMHEIWLKKDGKVSETNE